MELVCGRSWASGFILHFSGDSDEQPKLTDGGLQGGQDFQKEKAFFFPIFSHFFMVSESGETQIQGFLSCSDLSLLKEAI